MDREGSWTAAVYLCGPTPADPAEPSWRPDAVAALWSLWSGAGRLAVFLPEPMSGGSYPAYADQVAWEPGVERQRGAWGLRASRARGAALRAVGPGAVRGAASGRCR
ncbi:hypothetical protein ABZ766_06440 [Streptomyces sp. NPDC006670]|uniref:hypothetical protein n=1 Tax=Streptomyces sp. NPDC006670 TaxID=3154476 RepID=UPI0033EC447A